MANHNPRLQTQVHGIALAVLIGWVLHVGRDVLVPVAYSALLVYVVLGMTRQLARIPGLGPRLPSALRYVVSAAVILAATAAFAADITVGFVTSLSGPASSIGVNYDKGMKAAFAYQRTVGGRAIRLINLDDGSDPSAATQNARKLVQQDHVDIMIGTSSAPGTNAMLAVANESWWSIAHAPPDDQIVTGSPYPRRAENARGGDAARQRAIDYYREVVRLAPASPEAAAAQRRLPRLGLGLDTGQRRFFCFSC